MTKPSGMFRVFTASLFCSFLAITIITVKSAGEENVELGSTLVLVGAVVLAIAFCADLVDRPNVRTAAKSLKGVAIGIALPATLFLNAVDLPGSALFIVAGVAFGLLLVLAWIGWKSPIDGQPSNGCTMHVEQKCESHADQDQASR